MLWAKMESSSPGMAIRKWLRKLTLMPALWVCAAAQGKHGRTSAHLPAGMLSRPHSGGWRGTARCG
jgi:hypothetical protein